jgi:hypothetical protein
LFEGGNNDISLSRPLYCPFEGFGINGQIDHGLLLLIPLLNAFNKVPSHIPLATRTMDRKSKGSAILVSRALLNTA